MPRHSRPSGSTAQSDGTCLQTGDLGVNSATSSYGLSNSNSYQGSTVDLYTGDAAATDTSTGYTAPSEYGSAKDYLPVRK